MSVWIRPGRHAVDPDAVRPELARHGLGEAEHAGLGGRVVRPAEDAAAALGRDRRHAGDRALLARAHMRDEGLAQVEHARHVDVDDALPVFGRDLHQLQRLGDAGVVDEDIDLTEGRDRLLGRALCSSRGRRHRSRGRYDRSPSSAAALLAPSASRSRMATRAPCSANSLAVARPMPRALAAPEMTAVLPFSSIGVSPFILARAIAAGSAHPTSEKFPFEARVRFMCCVGRIRAARRFDRCRCRRRAERCRGPG